jgi:predicted nucleic acid-binding protein
LTAYVDSSFFVSLYAVDGHSAAARELMSLKPSVWLTPLHTAEFVHAITRQVFLGKISPAESVSVYQDLEHDNATGIWQKISLPENAFELCAELARRHGAKLGIRTLDSLHVASALELKADRFWTFDERQAKLAKAEGLKTI